ncbi:unnamed protein product [Nyctereutes procyonoides]|uniref:(raccoon dog) hypothetical protein n=1 Tax=Nyctereutes procyonoides TaxID=34880 RepID=A0A811ZCM7_NYCPR|nr:unnamed protein product [Nyctereutes procyonoides]
MDKTKDQGPVTGASPLRCRGAGLGSVTLGGGEGRGGEGRGGEGRGLRARERHSKAQ